MKAFAAIVLLAACHPAKPTAPAAVENAAPSRLTLGYVVVSRGAWVRSAPSADAPGARLATLTGAITDDVNLGKVWVARLIADEGEWVEVENLTWEEAQPHCYGTIGPLTGYKLRLHVRKADLMPITRHQLESYFDDGSGATLSAGVVAAPRGDRFVVGDSVNAELHLEPEAIGTSYLSPSYPLDEVDAESLTQLPPGDFVVDGQALALPGNLYDRAVVADGPDAQHQEVTVSLPCTRYRGLVEKQELGMGVSWGDGGDAYGTISTGSTDLPEVRANAALTWPDGTPAGETVDQVQMVWPVTRAGDRYCFPIPLLDRDDRPADATGKEDWFLTVCVQDADWIPGFGG